MTPGEQARLIAEALGGVPSGAGWKAHCPAHDDQNASLSITERNGKVLVHCHADCTQEAVIGALKERGLWETEQNWSGSHKAKSRELGKVLAEYDYTDANGALVGQVVRYEPKTFRQRKPDGAGGWTWKLDGLQLPLYRLPGIASSPAVVIAEGEKDVEALRSIRIPATCNPGGASKWRAIHTEALVGKRVAIIADADAPGRTHAQAVAAELHAVAESVRVLECPDEHKDPADWIANGATRETILETIKAAPLWEPKIVGAGRPEIQIEGGRLPEIVDAAEAALIRSDDQAGLYQRGGQIVRVVRLEADQDGAIRRAAGSPIIVPVEPPSLQESFTRAARWLKHDARRKGWRDCDCPAQVGIAYAARIGQWNLRPLMGVVNAPTLRRDGSVVDRPGYDERTGLLLVGNQLPEIPRSPSKDDALDALASLKERLSKFPFVADADRSVAVSAILTALVRRSLRSAPLHAFTAPTMGTGKSLLADVVALIATGQTAPAMSQGQDSTEDRKKIMASLMAGDAVLLLDNIERPIEGETLCSLLTQAEIRDRVLGASRMATASTAVTLLATGNNLQLRGDMTTRALVCRIDAGVERPEERAFAGDLRLSILNDRADLVRAGLTVLRAYHVADRPPQDVKPYGRFEDWSDLVRSALIWLGEADPCDTRERIQRADETALHLAAMLTAWSAHFQDRSETVKLAMDEPPDDLQDAMLDVAGDRSGAVNPRVLGKWLSKMEGRVCDGFRFTKGPKVMHKQTWRAESLHGP